MPKNARSSSSVAGKKNKKNRKNDSNDSLCYNCTPIELNEYLNSNNSEKKYEIDDFGCPKYYKDNDLVYQRGQIPDINVEEYLTLRISKLQDFNSSELQLNDEDCISINPIDNTVIINNTLIKSKNIAVSRYISNGCYGVIFVSSEVEGVTYVIKLIIFNEKNKNEIETMIDIKKRNNTNIPNFINIAYYHFKCNAIRHNSKSKLLNGIDTTLKKKEYTMLILEYFDDEVYSKLKHVYGEPETLTNDKKCIYAQMLLSIYLFHNKFNYYHKDAHLKNFLYKKVTANEKYFHYKIKNARGEEYNYYIKNEGYIVVLSDFGLSQKKERVQLIRELPRDDYYDILFNIESYFISGHYFSADIKDRFKEYFNKIYRSQQYDELEFLNFMMINILGIKTELIRGDAIINAIAYE